MAGRTLHGVRTAIQMYRLVVPRRVAVLQDVAEAPAYIAGRWVSDGTPAARTGPHARTVVSRSYPATPDQLAAALEFAGTGAKAVAALAPATRAGILERASRLATEHRDRIAALIALELGKPLKDGRGEMDRVADTFAVCAHETRRIAGEMPPVAGPARGAA